jgi:protein-L-isoaspartate(D-aspartate) O-methyltransferase
MERLEAHRRFYADLVTAAARVPQGNTTIREAFASVPREDFAGSGPWRIFTPSRQIETPTDDPAFLYQDILISLRAEGGINNGQPSLHAACLAALDIKEGETVVHVGAGGGYYTAILATLTRGSGRVFAYEIEEDLAQRARQNLAGYTNVTLYARSGSEPPLPSCDVLYVNAGATAPMSVWLDALNPGGRLLFPLTPAEGYGGMLLLTRGDAYSARFICGALFIPCVGARDEETAEKLTGAFRRGTIGAVRSLRRNDSPDESCWVAGRGWWLSTS